MSFIVRLTQGRRGVVVGLGVKNSLAPGLTAPWTSTWDEIKPLHQRGRVFARRIGGKGDGILSPQPPSTAAEGGKEETLMRPQQHHRLPRAFSVISGQSEGSTKAASFCKIRFRTIRGAVQFPSRLELSDCGSAWPGLFAVARSAKLAADKQIGP